MCTDGHYHQFHQDITTGQVKRIMYLRAFMLWYAFTGPGAIEEAARPTDKDAHPTPDKDATTGKVPDMAIPDGIVLDSLVRP